MRVDDLTWRIDDRPGETFRVHRSIYNDIIPRQLDIFSV